MVKLDATSLVKPVRLYDGAWLLTSGRMPGCDVGVISLALALARERTLSLLYPHVLSCVCVCTCVNKHTYSHTHTHTHTHTGGDLGISDCKSHEATSYLQLVPESSSTGTSCNSYTKCPYECVCTSHGRYIHMSLRVEEKNGCSMCVESRGSYVPAAEDIYMHVCMYIYILSVSLSLLSFSPLTPPPFQD